jgi:hypothetical protein
MGEKSKKFKRECDSTLIPNCNQGDGGGTRRIRQITVP